MTAPGTFASPVITAEAKRLLDQLAHTPRPAGSEAERDAQRQCRALLEKSGFAVSEESFTYSAFPGRYATPLAGVTSIVALALAAWLGYSGRPGTALGVLLTTAVALGVAGLVVAMRGVLGLGFARAESVNLVASRGAPRLWLMAHIDTKSQPVSMAARVAGIAGSAIVWISAIALAGAGSAWKLSDDWRSIGWPAVGLLGLIAGVPVAASLVASRSPGAFDNASGVVSVLLVASRAPASLPLGVVITSAEELGLAGARAWVKGRAAGVAINVDGVDDAGMLTAMTTRRSTRLASLFARAATRVGVPHRTIRLVPGILADSVALTDAGWESITVSHGSLKSLARIHTARDIAHHISGTGINRATTVMSKMLEELA